MLKNKEKEISSGGDIVHPFDIALTEAYPLAPLAPMLMAPSSPGKRKIVVKAIDNANLPSH